MMRHSVSLKNKLIDATQNVARLETIETNGHTGVWSMRSEKNPPETVNHDGIGAVDLYKTKISTLMIDAYHDLEEAYTGKTPSGISTGYADLDRMVLRLQPGELIVIAAQPGMGGTSLAMGMVSNITMGKGSELAVVIFSLEMSATKWAKRMLAATAEVSTHKLHSGKFTAHDWRKLASASGVLAECKIFVDDTASEIIEIFSHSRDIQEGPYGLDLIVIDYLQLISSTGRNKENRVQEIAEISQGLKAIAKELDIPVITASQLSRAVESREDKRPLLSDLRESGNIEQDADIVMFIYREEYYLSRKIPSSDEKKLIEWQEKMEKVESIAEIIIAKQRNGPVGNFHLRYDNKTTAFDNLEN